MDKVSNYESKITISLLQKKKKTLLCVVAADIRRT